MSRYRLKFSSPDVQCDYLDMPRIPGERTFATYCEARNAADIECKYIIQNNRDFVRSSRYDRIWAELYLQARDSLGVEHTHFFRWLIEQVPDDYNSGLRIT